MPNLLFPTVNDIGGGRILQEASLAAWMAAVSGRNFVVSGFNVPSPPGGLSITIPAGAALISGYLAYIDSGTALTFSSGTATYSVYAVLARDGFGNVTGASLVSNTTGIAPADSVLLCNIGVVGSNITVTTDRRPKGGQGVKGYQPQAIVNTTVNVGSTGETPLLDVTTEGKIIGLWVRRLSAFTTHQMSIKFQIDGQPAVDLPFNDSTAVQLQGADFIWESTEVFNVTGTGRDVSGEVRKLLIDLPFTSAARITANVTSAGSGQWGFRVLYAKTTS